MILHRVRLTACPARPWRNGGGHARELLAWPAPDDWSVRVSVASIDAAGPFSGFAGIDRWIAALDGAGVRLVFADGTRSLGADGTPIAFAGEAQPYAQPVAGATTDLNLMVRRGTGEAAMIRAEARSTLTGPTRWRALYAADAVRIRRTGPRRPAGQAAQQVVEPDTLLWAGGSADESWTLLDSGRAWWMSVR